MDDLLDIEKLNALVYAETNSEQENPLKEFENLIGDDNEEDGEQNEDEISNVNSAEERLNNTEVEYSDAPRCVKTLLPCVNEEEQQIINSCEDPQLKELMVLNRTQNVQCIKTLNKIIEALNITHRLIWQQKCRLNKNEKLWETSTLGLGHPYFKIANSFCIVNEDVMRKRNNNELMKFKSPVKWNDLDKEELHKQVELEYLRIRGVNIIKRIDSLKKEKRTATDYEERSRIEKIIEELEHELSNSAEHKFTQPVVNCEGFDWERISQKLNSKHTAVECEVFWKTFLSPSVNKSGWSEDEDCKIKELAEKYRYQDWDTIASKLGTNRSAFSVCSHYYSKLCKNSLRERFFPDEDRHLLEVVEACRVGTYISWPKVAQHFDNRNTTRLYQRFKYYLSLNKDILRTRFSIAEDALILCLVHRFGKNFLKIASFIPQRSLKQIQIRYSCYLGNLLLHKGYWAEEEDRKILAYVAKHGTGRWNKLSKDLNRSRGNTRHRFYVLLTWLRNNPGKDVADITRKKTFKEYYVQHEMHIKDLFEKFKNRKEIPSLKMLNEELENRLNSCSQVIDDDCTVVTDVKKTRVAKVERTQVTNVERTGVIDMDSTPIEDAHEELIDFFKNSYQISTKKDLVIADSKHTAKLIYDVTQLLAANLQIPSEEHLENDPNLDEDDLVLLKYVRGFQESRSSNRNIQFLVPPNINTVTGLSSLIIQNSLKKETSDDTNEIIELDDDASNEQECKLFEQRLFSLFYWPSILSLHPPLDTLIDKQFITETPKHSMNQSPCLIKKNMSRIGLMACTKQKTQRSNTEQKTEFPVPKTPTIKVKTFANINNLHRKECMPGKCEDKRIDLLQPSTSLFRNIDDKSQVTPNPQPKNIIPEKVSFKRTIKLDITDTEMPQKRKKNEKGYSVNKFKVVRVYSSQLGKQNV